MDDMKEAVWQSPAEPPAPGLKVHLLHLVFGGGEGSTSHFRHQGGGTPLDSDLDWGAGKEANSLAGGARGDGGVEEEGTNFHQHQDFDFEHLSI